MRVLIADKLPDTTRTRLASTGFEVHVDASLSGDALEEALGNFDPEVLVVRSTKVHGTHASAAPSLGLVIRAGAGYNTIDVAACSERAIYVANCPGKNAVAVAELTMGLMLALDRSIADNVVDMRAGRWNKGAYGKGHGLRGRTLGIIGLGSIGRAVAERAHAFGMNVVVWSRSLSDEAAEALGVKRVATPEEVAVRADVLTVHLALTPETRGLIGDAVFDAMKHGATFLNTSRAEVVNEASLRRALDEKGLRAGLDVLEGEPSAKTGEFSHPLGEHPQVYVTHHIGASTAEAQEAVGDEVCRIASAFRDEGLVHNVVNAIERSAATHRLVVRHLDKVGVLATVLDRLSKAGINVQEMENVVFPGGGAIARIQTAAEPSHEVLTSLEADDSVIHASVVPIQHDGQH